MAIFKVVMSKVLLTRSVPGVVECVVGSKIIASPRFIAYTSRQVGAADLKCLSFRGTQA